MSDRPKIMGILNVTPDSFSDGGQFLDPRKAIEKAWNIAQEGADILDIGAESTRPGAEAVHSDEEWRRLKTVLEELHRTHFPIPISLDTAKAELARFALEKGFVQMINDVEGLRSLEMVQVVKDFQVPVVLMHMFGNPRTMQKEFQYDDVVKDLIQFFKNRMKETGLKENVILDPGLGFGKNVEQNLEILRRLSEFKALGFPILIGGSRKSFIGKVLNAEVQDRLEGSLAVVGVALQNGASIVRVHDVASTVRYVRMWEALR